MSNANTDSPLVMAYPLLLILIKEATPSPSILGRVNGMAASAGAACRMIAPPVAGYLYTIGSKADCTAIAWYGSAFVAVVGSIQCFSVKRAKVEDEISGESSGLLKKTQMAVVTAVDEDDY